MIYVMSDIHGNTRRFDSILKQIDLQPEDTLYILGDVIDRFPDGIKLLRRIMAMPNVKMLLGNHEYMMLQSINQPYQNYEYVDDAPESIRCNLWYRNGGDVTHQYWKRIRKTMRQEIVDYLQSLPLNYDVHVNGKHYKLVHGAPLDAYEVFAEFFHNIAHYAVWKRWRRYDVLSGKYTLIFGHTPTITYQDSAPMRIWHGMNMIGIDCGGGFSEDPLDDYYGYGRLACLRLDDMKEYYSEEPGCEAKE